jgi:RNA polymerase sigma-B factor
VRVKRSDQELRLQIRAADADLAQQLSHTQQRQLMMRFYGNLTQAEIGAELGIPQMHVSRLQHRALAYLRERITGAPANP